MATLLLLILFITSFILLGWAAAGVVRAGLKLAHLGHINPYVVSFFIAGGITSLPELFVGLAAAFTDRPDIALGNIIGSNLLGITLVIGLVTMLSGAVNISKKAPKKLFYASALVSTLPIFLISDGRISRGEGGALLVIFAIYALLFFLDREHVDLGESSTPFNLHFYSNIFANIKTGVIALVVLFISSWAIVLSGGALAYTYGMSNLYFGMIFLALATTLPEFVFGVRSALLNHPAAIMDNVLGTLVFNSTFVLGLVAIISPISLGAATSGIFLVGGFFLPALIIFGISAYTGSRITKDEGLLLALWYLLFFLVSVVL